MNFPRPPEDGASSPPPIRMQKTYRRDARIALGIAGLYLLFWQVSLRIPSGHIAIVMTTTLLSLLLVLAFTASVARALVPPRTLAANLLVVVPLALPSVLIPILGARFPLWAGWKAIGPFYVTYTGLFRAVPGLHGLLLIWLAAAIGVWLSRLVRELKILLPIAVVLAVVDLYVVFGGGLVTQAQAGGHAAQQAMAALTVSLPTTHPRGGAAPMQLAVGFADFLFIALFFACFARFGIPARRTFGVLCGVLAGYMLLVGSLSLALPALVPIALVVIGMNLPHFRYTRSEAFALLYAGLIVAVVAGGFYFFGRGGR